jgi:muramoyltetrapeptide carboxypeptidase LdcA involved in peptidoglycan recycling
MNLLKPLSLSPGDTIGIFTPSSPSYKENEDMFQCGVHNLERLGFRVKLGFLTAERSSQGYRSGTPESRAREFMDLIRDPEVKGLISTIGGNNSSSLIPYIDFAEVRKQRKLICGYSDVTALHLAILHHSGLRTLYGPAVMTWIGDWPSGDEESLRSFLEAVSPNTSYPRKIRPFHQWSNHKRSWSNGDWKKLPRQWKSQSGWRVLRSGEVRGPLIVANLSTLMSAAGTPHFPNLQGKLLLIESMAAGFATEERHLRHLQLLGAFNQVTGLIVGKPEWPDSLGAPFSHNDLIKEVVGDSTSFPIVSEFDCGHTLPMMSLAQMTEVRLSASGDHNVDFEILAPMVSNS